MNIGGLLHPNIFWRIRQFEIENHYEHFPGYGTDTLKRYCQDIEKAGQFKIIYDSIYHEPIAFALWWYLPTVEMCRTKSWEKPYPSNLNNGEYAYIDFVLATRNYRSFNLVRRLLMDCHRMYPEKHVCFHRYRGTNEMKFYHRKPLKCENALSVAA